jgi:site-specific recombinase XerD
MQVVAVGSDEGAAQPRPADRLGGRLVERIQALKNYLASRGQPPDDQLFLNYAGEPIGERGVCKLVVKYKRLADITKKGSCHSLRYTFASYKAECDLTPFQLQELLGHESINTT